MSKDHWMLNEEMEKGSPKEGVEKDGSNNPTATTGGSAVYAYQPYYAQPPYYNQPMYQFPEDSKWFVQPKSPETQRLPVNYIPYSHTDTNGKMMAPQGYQMVPPPPIPLGHQGAPAPPPPPPPGHVMAPGSSVAASSSHVPPPGPQGQNRPPPPSGHPIGSTFNVTSSNPMAFSNQTPSSLSNNSNSPSRDPSIPIVTEELGKKKQKIGKYQTLTRKRALTACNTCRVKKVKCDNIRPRCGSCVKNGIENCEYSNEDQIKDMSYDPSSAQIMNKLDNILDDLQILKSGTVPVSHTENFDLTQSKPIPPSGVFDMSFTSIMRWDYFSRKVPDLLYNYDDMNKQLMSLYNEKDFGNYQVTSIADRLSHLDKTERVLFNSLGQTINSFFVNCHTKIPVLDILDFLESIELYKLFQKTIPEFSLIKLAEDYYNTQREGKLIGDIYVEALSISGTDDLPFRRNAYFSLCKKIPLIPVICALGVIASSIQLDNFAKYKSSLEERNDLASSCLTEESINVTPKGTLKERLSVAYSFITYSKIMIDFWPGIYKEHSSTSIFYNLFLNQFSLYIMKPAEAYKHISLACQDMMYYLEKRRSSNQEVSFKNPKKQKLIERLFWICLKLECELRAELSPKVPMSGITNVIPPCSFPTIPEPIINEQGTGNHSDACIQIATKFDDQYTWYYFLTEVAIRKVDNELYNEFYSVEANKSRLWDQPNFIDEKFWISFIRYLNQYNGIINSLSPRIRSFVLKEADVGQIFKSVANAYERRKVDDFSSHLLSQDLDDFLIDDDLLIQAQSESIMYIKTRILTSKLLLFRPIVYLILEDRIPVQDLLEGALAVFAEKTEQLGEHNSQSSSSSLETSSYSDNNVQMDYDKLLDAPLYYQKNNANEDFSGFFSSEDGKSSDSYFKINQLHLAKKKIIKLFFVQLQSAPKLNLPKLAGHRHPGQWYYLRNLLTGNFYMFLLYKKLQDILEKVKSDPSFRSLFETNPFIQSIGNLSDILDTLLPKDIISSTFKHALLVYEYWKDECKDCTVYAQIVQKCIDHLN